MRVILATDGSASARISADLVAACRWPEGSTIDVVGVLDVMALLPAPFSPTPVDLQPLEDGLALYVDQSLVEARDRIRSAGLSVTVTRLTGHPVDAIARYATEVGADLIVCGSRGHGALRSLLLGSVSAGLADRAHCPVLVARHPTAQRVLLADDGSEPALAAERVVETWPMFEESAVDVLSVAYVHPVWRSAVGMLALGPGFAWDDDAVPDGRQRAEQVNRDAVARLAAAGRTAAGVVLDGDPADVIVSEAAARGADLIVVGTHGRGAIDRLVLGSVARAVLLHAHTSVLVVRPPAPPTA